LQEAYPGQVGRRVSGDARLHFADDVPTIGEAASQLEYIRQLRAGKVQQPDPVRCWEIGSALGPLSKKRWLNPVVMLFAFGHYGEVADIIVRSRDTIATGPLAELVRCLPGVFEDNRQQSFADIKDDFAVRDAKMWDKAMGGSLSPERRAWSIDGRTYAAFAQAWRAQNVAKAPLAGCEAAVGACALIADHALYPIADRDRQVALILTDWLSR